MSKYSRLFKIQMAKRLVEEYISSKDLGREIGVDSRQVRYWASVYRIHGVQAFAKPCSPFSAHDKYQIISQMWTNSWSLAHTSAVNNLVSCGILLAWKRLYEAHGIDGLEPRRRRLLMKKAPPKKKLPAEMSPEEMQEELEYLRAENAVLKKLEALAQSKKSQTKKKR